MRRFLVICLAVAMLMGLISIPAAAGPNGITVSFNRHAIQMDVPPRVEAGRTLVPFRAIFEKMGATVTYDGATQTLTAVRDNTTIRLQVGNRTATVNGQSRTLDVAPMIVNDRTLIPLRFVGEALGASVNYDPTTQHVDISDPTYPKRGGTLTGVLWSAPVQELNPLVITDAYTQWVVSPIFSALWNFDETITPTPDLATHWEISNDNKMITFYLRKDAKFHDGVAVTAHDIALSFYAIMHPDYKGPLNVGFDSVEGYERYQASGNKADLTGLQILDNHTLRFKLTQVDAPFFLTNTALGYAIPRHKYESVPIGDWGTSKDPNNDHPIGSGPFKFGQFVDGQYVTLDRNPNYYGGEVYLDRFVWRVAAPDVALGALRTGDYHFADLKIQDLEAVSKLSNLRVIEYPDLVWQHMTFNVRQPYLADKRVRQAIAYALDRPALINQLLAGHAAAMYAPMHPLSWAYTEDVEKYPRNLQKTTDLLTQAGYTRRADGWYKDGKKLSLSLLYPTGNPVRMASAPIIQAWLQEAGIEITLERMDFGALNDKAFIEFDYDLMLLGWQITPDPDPRGLYAKDQIGEDLYNVAGWWTEKSESLMEKAVRTVDLEERQDLYLEWQQHFAEEAPVIPLYAANTIYGVNTSFMNFKPTPAGVLWNVAEWWLNR